ncbi:DUF5666 domain-containing protein [Dactylosporangium sp. AC04546]|uniref:DUF5666 domain-containing protein n=1 Tax=Dactylosporangium sp. AC04546 TaxID=2862460 RepID=UPI001EDD1736|nr:DUF5666 domain-containing protein [Dactylosporangium sp. AC04546]WVK89167.1 DUF5666 domain-containing protein [Dactylosporangium sp. AC04546]
MTEDQTNGTPVPPWAGPAPETPPAARTSGGRSSKLKIGIVAAVSGVIVVGGGVAVANAASTGTGAVQQGPGGGHSGYGGYGGPGGQGFPGGGQPGRGGMERGGMMGALHGDFVVKDSAGKYVTHRLQSGTVTAVSDTSITVKSEDGFSTTFVVNGSTKVHNGSAKIGDVKTGQTVTVVGTVDGTTVTATTIADRSLRGDKTDKQPRGSGEPKPTKTA